MSETLIASVLDLDRKAVNALRITDLYSLHRVVYSLYDNVRGEDAQNQSSGILFYASSTSQGRRILMLSNREPALHVDGQHGEVRSKPIPSSFLEYDRYRFKVLINPTRRNNASGKVLPVKGREAIGQWFCERAEASWGFQADAERLQIDAVDVLRFTDKNRHPVTLAQAHLQGLLSVTDRGSFQRSFGQGIGRARAFGCGLLQIVPLIDTPFA
ncbi:type I-E CRISPR-associated protein Cas6/Cse3/CasE [Alphaproteobacteria bacterium]|nr:type I-E CRISPR-associated protein Cas6/Cse3/CasE [Alphaproteobacteria bacterium]